MKFYSLWTCPYCGQYNATRIDTESKWIPDMLATCDNEKKAGCGQRVMLITTLAIHTEAKRIEGYQDVVADEETIEEADDADYADEPL